jgi:uncharacterized protein (TIGR02117 family)
VVKPVADALEAQHEWVYVVSHGWHTGFVLSAQLLQSHYPKLKDRFGDAAYIEIGWGDKGFYQAKEITSGLTIQAIFWPTESVMHVVAVSQPVEDYFKNSQVEKICLGGAEYASLRRFIKSSFHLDENGEIIAMQKGIYGDSQFYQGEGEYYLMNTCNTWTAKGLQSAGMDISPIFKLTAGSVMNYLQQHRQSLEDVSYREERPPGSACGEQTGRSFH